MSFALTTNQVRNRSKTVTRRVGWKFLKPGDYVRAVVKCQGLKKGEKIEPLAVIRVVDVRREPLILMARDTAYGMRETGLEGFPGGKLHDPSHFVPWFAAGHGIDVCDEVTRIEFEYV